MKKTIALVKGDGSGPEMMAVACAIVIEAAKRDGIEIEFEETPMGWNAYHKFGDTLPKESLERVIELGTIFFGGVGDPKYDDTIGKEKPEIKPEARALLTLRKRMGLLLNFRPMIFYPELKHLSRLRPEFIPDWVVKQIFIRFLLEDSYFGTADLMDEIDVATREKLGIKLKKDVTGNEEIITELAYYRKETIEKYIRAAFNYAKAADLPLLSVDKANVMARYDFWRKIVTRIGKEEFSNIPLCHEYVDAANSILVDPARLHGVIVCGNEHGDILSDGGASIPGGMGMMCSSAINPDTGVAMFESGAGTAPMLAGQNKANPLGRVLTGAMMLRHIGAEKGATAIENAVRDALLDGYRTSDLTAGKKHPNEILLGTKEMGVQVLSYL